MSHLVASIQKETRLTAGSIVQIAGLVLNFTIASRQLDQQAPMPWAQPNEPEAAPEE